jgi:hypothetical protein
MVLMMRVVFKMVKNRGLIIIFRDFILFDHERDGEIVDQRMVG